MSEREVTPAAAKLAEEEGIDASAIEGTGSGGNVIKADIEAAVAKGGASLTERIEGAADALNALLREASAQGMNADLTAFTKTGLRAHLTLVRFGGLTREGDEAA